MFENIFVLILKVDIKGVKALVVVDASSDLVKEARDKIKVKVDVVNDFVGKIVSDDVVLIFVKGLDFGIIDKKLCLYFVAAA